jgi:formylglycine-generating enzyme required for sulfatase activity
VNHESASISNSSAPRCPAGMADIPGGSFTMGSRIPATVSEFCLDRTEVTVDAYKKCVDAGTCTEPDAYANAADVRADASLKFHQACNWKHPEGRENHPINCVDWNQASSYCSWVGGRLPKEEEWEWAARNGDKGDSYPWGAEGPNERLLNACGRECPPNWKAKFGQTLPKSMYTRDDGYAETAPVAAFPKGNNRWGVSDLAGNVREWTSSLYYTHSGHPFRRVCLGGSFSSEYHADVSASFRPPLPGDEPGVRFLDLGFRCSRTP